MRTRCNSDAPIRTASGSERVTLRRTRMIKVRRTRSLPLAVLSARPFDPVWLMKAALLVLVLISFPPGARADQLRLTDGTTMEVDEAWEDAQGVWYRRGGVTYLVERSRVKEVVKAGQEATKTAGGWPSGRGTRSLMRP